MRISVYVYGYDSTLRGLSVYGYAGAGRGWAGSSPAGRNLAGFWVLWLPVWLPGHDLGGRI